MDAAGENQQFFGVYLLFNVNPSFKGRTYIGFTVNPNRRIQQHNKGKQAGGAWRTHGRGPWEMVLIIHGFPNEISALRFEWAWQNPQKSRRLKHLPGKKKKETQFQYRVRIVSVMLNTAPWCRLALTIRWLKQNYITDFPINSTPPAHMPIAYGPVKIKKSIHLKKGNKPEEKEDEDDELLNLLKKDTKHIRCSVCRERLQNSESTLKCIHPKCPMQSHIVCLAKKFLSNDSGSHIIPIEGRCPRCMLSMRWGDLIRLKQGCYQNLEECTSSDGEDSDSWTDQLNTQKS